jgi:hypothetical protein
MTEGTKTFYMKAIDQAGNESACSISSIAYEYDATNPDPVTSLSNDTTTASGSQSPVANWVASGSGDLNHYEIALGTSSGGNEIMDWANIATPLTYQYTTLSLTNCSTYYISVRSVDNAGNKSAAVTGPAFTYDGVAPSVVSSMYLDGDGSKSAEHTAHWSAATDNCGLSHYLYAIGTTSGGEEELTFTDIGNVLLHQEGGIAPDLLLGTDYYTTVKAVDNAGNIGAPTVIGPWRRGTPSGLFLGNRTTAPSANTNINQGTAYELEYSVSSFDADYFNHDTGTNPEDIEVLVSGDYLLSFNMPMASAVQRANVLAEVLVNGTPVSSGVANSAYIRSASGHDEASDHMSILLTGLLANDIISIQVGQDAGAGVVTTTNAAVNLEYVDSTSRVVFSGTSTNTTSGTNFNTIEAALEWTEARNDAGITHDDASNPDQIKLDNGGDYLVFVNVPMQSACGSVRQNVAVTVKINGGTITGGVAQNGYIRCASGHNESSAHWFGLVQNVTANSILTVTVGSLAGTYNTPVRSGKTVSIYVEEVDTTRRTLSVRGTQVTGGTPDSFNPGGLGEDIVWATQDITDADIFEHSTSTNAEKITIKRGGDYQVVLAETLYSTVQRAAPVIDIKVNGTPLGPAACKTNYIRASGGTNEASCAFVYTLDDLSYNDEITFGIKAEAAAGLVDDVVPAILTIIKK